MKIRNLLMCAVALFMSFLLSNCDENYEYYNKNEIHIGLMDFELTNKTTGESFLYLPGKSLDAKNGDVLEMTFTPLKNYEEYTWKVDFDIFGIEVKTISKPPYVYTYTIKDVKVGSHKITCSADVEESGITFAGDNYGSFTVNVLE